MTPQEILNEIYKLPLVEQENISKNLSNHLENELKGAPVSVTKEELYQYLFSKGVITHIPKGMTDEEDDFEPVEIEGEPLSETIIRERR